MSTTGSRARIAPGSNSSAPSGHRCPSRRPFRPQLASVSSFPPRSTPQVPGGSLRSGATRAPTPSRKRTVPSGRRPRQAGRGLAGLHGADAGSVCHLGGGPPVRFIPYFSFLFFTYIALLNFKLSPVHHKLLFFLPYRQTRETPPSDYRYLKFSLCLLFKCFVFKFSNANEPQRFGFPYILLPHSPKDQFCTEDTLT